MLKQRAAGPVHDTLRRSCGAGREQDEQRMLNGNR
jgi:hypothetical protein